jgi:hypothetical protein
MNLLRQISILMCAMLLTFCPVSLSAQDAALMSLTANKFDEFGSLDYSDLIARLDNFSVELLNNPTARGYVIFYRTHRDLPGASIRQATLAKNYAIGSRGVDASRVVALDGIRDCLGGELWIVPTGATPPTPTNTRRDYSFVTDYAYKYDEHYYGLPGDIGEMGSSPDNDLSTYLDGFAAMLKARAVERAYIIGYAQNWVIEDVTDEVGSDGKVRRKHYRDARIDRPGVIEKILATEKNYLIKKHSIKPARIVTVNGGYRRGRNVELWIVPRGERPPVPTPNVYPPRRRKR